MASSTTFDESILSNSLPVSGNNGNESSNNGENPKLFCRKNSESNTNCNNEYYVMVHVDAGEIFSVRFGEHIQHIPGSY